MLKDFVLKKIHSNLGRDAIWTLGIQVLVMICALLLNKILSNTLTIEVFGQYNIIRRSTSVLSFTILGGIGIALPRFLPYYQQKGFSLTQRNILLGALLYVTFLSIATITLCVLFKDSLSKYIIGDSDDILLYIVLLYSISGALCSLVFAYYRGMSKFKAFNVSQLFSQIILIVPLVGLFAIDIRNLFAFWTIINFLFVILIFSFESLKYRWILFRQLQFKALKCNISELSLYSLPRLAGDFILFSLNAFPLIYLGAYENLKIASYYSVGVAMVTMVSPLFSILGVVLLPYVSKQVAAGMLRDSDRVIHKLLLCYMIIALLAVIIVFAFMPFMISMFFSSEYYAAIDNSRILILSVIPSAIYYLYRNPIDAASKVPYNTFILMICAGVMGIGFYLADNIKEYSWVFFVVMTIKGLLSYILWKIIIVRQIKK